MTAFCIDVLPGIRRQDNYNLTMRIKILLNPLERYNYFIAETSEFSTLLNTRNSVVLFPILRSYIFSSPCFWFKSRLLILEFHLCSYRCTLFFFNSYIFLLFVCSFFFYFYFHPVRRPFLSSSTIFFVLSAFCFI